MSDFPSVFLVRIDRPAPFKGPRWLRPYSRIGDAKAQATRQVNDWNRKPRPGWSATVFRIDVPADGLPVMTEVPT